MKGVYNLTLELPLCWKRTQNYYALNYTEQGTGRVDVWKLMEDATRIQAKCKHRKANACFRARVVTTYGCFQWKQKKHHTLSQN
jgi:hypothetical protein